jgi:hypothetical protein
MSVSSRDFKNERSRLFQLSTVQWLFVESPNCCETVQLSQWEVFVSRLSPVSLTLVCRAALPATLVHKQWREFEALHCPMKPNVI